MESKKKFLLPPCLLLFRLLMTVACAFPSGHKNYIICLFICESYLPLECKPHEERTSVCLVHCGTCQSVAQCLSHNKH